MAISAAGLGGRAGLRAGFGRFAGSTLRADERALVASAGAVFAMASAGAAMAAAAADAMFLAEIGRERFGAGLAISSALLAVVLAVAGGLADRLDRRRVLGGLAIASAVALLALAAAAPVAPVAVAWATYIGGKQLAAATDLAFWVAIAERVDARRSQRVVPRLAARGGIGAAIGAALVIPIGAAAGPRGILVAAAVLLAVAAVGAARLDGIASRVTGVAAAGAGSAGAAAGARAGTAAFVVRAWRDGARAVRRYPLAAHLAAVVAIAGVFGSLAYAALGFAVAARGGAAGDFAQLFGGVRAAGQVLTLVIQLAIAPRLLARLGTGRALLVAPLVAVASGLGLVAAPILAVAIATQISARALDAGVETPAEKLAQTLLPARVRGRVAGFLDGTAKRAGAVVGGVLAAAFAGAPVGFYACAAVFGALWALAAARIARELPALAIERVAGAGGDRDAALDDVVDARAIDALFRELAGDHPERAAELLARLHAAGRVDAVRPLAAAAVRARSSPVWRALIAALCGADTPADAQSAELLAAAAAAPPKLRPLILRAVGLAGGVPASELDAYAATADDAPTAFAADIAALRLGAGEPADVLAALADATRDAAPIARLAIEELAVEVDRAVVARARGASLPPADNIAVADASAARALAAMQALQRGLRRGAGDAAARAAGFAALGRAIGALRGVATGEAALVRAGVLELVRERIDAGASAAAPDDALVSLMRTAAHASGDVGPEIAAAVGVLGALLESTAEPDDMRRLARALGEPDDAIRAAAEAAFAALGSAAAGELLAMVAWGRRRARDRAAALLADLPVTAATIDRLIDAELDALDQTAVAIAVVGGSAAPPADADPHARVLGLLVRRLDERLHEIAYTVLLLVAARDRSRAVARAAVTWRHARGPHERARTLAVVESALPRVLVRRLVDAVDELAPAERAAALAAAGHALPAQDAVVRAELAGRDRLARALVLHALGGAGRSAHRDAIADAARAEALAATPAELARRLARAALGSGGGVIEDREADMPTRVETLIALGNVPLLAGLSTRQLADVAERATWLDAPAGRVIASAGDPLDALWLVVDGELALGARVIAAGEVVDELACVAPVAAPADLVATRAARLVCLGRVDFEELVDDVPGLAAAVCRALGERARKAQEPAYRSPFATSK